MWGTIIQIVDISLIQCNTDCNAVFGTVKIGLNVMKHTEKNTNCHNRDTQGHCRNAFHRQSKRKELLLAVLIALKRLQNDMNFQWNASVKCFAK